MHGYLFGFCSQKVLVVKNMETNSKIELIYPDLKSKEKMARKQNQKCVIC